MFQVFTGGNADVFNMFSFYLIMCVTAQLCNPIKVKDSRVVKVSWYRSGFTQVSSWRSVLTWSWFHSSSTTIFLYTKLQPGGALAPTVDCWNINIKHVYNLYLYTALAWAFVRHFTLNFLNLYESTINAYSAFCHTWQCDVLKIVSGSMEVLGLRHSRAVRCQERTKYVRSTLSPRKKYNIVINHVNIHSTRVKVKYTTVK